MRENTPAKLKTSGLDGESKTGTVSRFPGRPVKVALSFVLLCLLYSAWMTGGSFSFKECKLWPNYDTLANSFLQGKLSIDKTGKEDFVLFNGRAYMYAGPVPALLRLPFAPDIHVPTGFMIVVACAGATVLIMLILPLVTQPDQSSFARTVRILFACVLVVNGFTLFMVTIPSFHHEAIALGMFFLLASLYLFFRYRSRAFRVTAFEGVLLGLTCGLCMGSRFSYALSIGLLACLFVGSMVIRYRAHRETKDIVTLTAFSAILAVSVGLLFTYNYLRFGSLLDFGMRHQASNVFRDYFLAGNYFRYDHIPYNLWSFFFRIPELVPRFPFIVLPAFTIEVRSYQFLPYHLLYRNDLSVSIFYMMPLLTLMVYPVVNRLFIRPDRPMWNYGLVFFLFMLQVLPPAFTVATTARYYYDVFPLAFILAYIGALQLIELGRIAFLPIGLLAFLSLVLSFSLPVQAMTFATGAIGYVAPMLHFF